MARPTPLTSAEEVVLPTGSTLDPAMVFAVATRTNVAQATLGTQLLGVGAQHATIRVPWRAELGACGATARWADFVVPMLVDHACSLAALMALDDAARWAGSLDLRVDYRRPLDASPFLVAHAVCDERVGAVMRVRAMVSADPDDDARVVVTLPGLEQHVGDASRRSVHGGVLAAFLEAAALAMLQAHGSGGPVTALSFTSAFVRPAQVVDTYAAVDVVRIGRRIAHVRVGAWQGDVDNFVATGQGTFSLR